MDLQRHDSNTIKHRPATAARSATADGIVKQWDAREYLQAAGFLEHRAAFLERTGQPQLAQVSRGVAYICRMRAASLQGAH